MDRELLFKEIFTDRLKLREVQKKDYIFQLNYLSDKKNFPYADYQVIKSIDGIEYFFKRMMDKHLKTSLFWMICDKKTDIPYGHISAWNVDFDENSIEFGYSIYPEYRNLGIMKEALKAVMEYCIKDLKFSKLDIWTDKDNIASIKLAEALDYKFTGYVVEKAKYSDEDIEYATYRKCT